jgi:mRNA-degrading endonuclease RelE of RelBE toxin-antitoxin system|nr:MAG TPA: RelE toxin of RelE / RelB toxin-antitoxin system [Caudoviricetes sp.]
MTRTFIETPIFTTKWKDLGLTDENLKELQNILLENPKLGDTISHTGGLRKIRIPMENKGKGKRSGARVIYIDIDVKETIYLVNVYSKDEKTDLTPSEKSALKAVVKILKEE